MTREHLLLLWAMMAVCARGYGAELGGLKQVQSCLPPPSLSAKGIESQGARGGEIWIVEQWHLPSGAKTVPGIQPKTPAGPGGLSASWPQQENLNQIFESLRAAIEKREIQVVFAEGFAGEADFKNPETFRGKEIQGWSHSLLLEAKKKGTLGDVVGSVPLILEALFEEKVFVFGVDEPQRIRDHGLAFSDARGYLGFLSRLDQPTFQKAAAEILGVPSTTTSFVLRQKLLEKLSGSVSRIEDAMKNRNEFMVQQMTSSRFEKESKPRVLVVGGSHAEGLVELLEKKGLPCRVFVPTKGFRSEEQDLLTQLKALVASQSAGSRAQPGPSPVHSGPVRRR